MSTENNKERYSNFYKKVNTHKRSLGNEGKDEVQKEVVDIFLGTLGQKIKKINEKNISDEFKNKAIDDILERAETLWDKKIKLKRSVKIELIKENYKGYIEKLNLYFEQGINEIDEEVIKDIGKTITGEFPFDGEFEMPQDFDDLMTQYNDAIRDLKLNLNTIWSKEKREKYQNAIDILEGHKNQLKKLKGQETNIDTDTLEDEYDKAVEQVINSEGYGKITVTIFGVEKTFNNKAEALYTLKESKKQLHEEFKSGFRSTWETLLFAYSQPLKLSKSIILGEFEDGEHSTFDTVGLAGEGLQDMAKIFNGEIHYFALGVVEEGLALGLGVIGVSLLATFIGMHRGVGESIYRRVGKDPLSKMVASMQYEDYGRTGHILNDFNTPEGKEFLEYQQREGLMEMFRQKLKANYTPGTPEYDEYKKKLDILDSYKLNKTKTFYSLAYKVSKGMPLGFKGNLNFDTLLFNTRRTILDGSKLYGYNPFKKGEDLKWFRIKNEKGEIRPKLGGFHSVEIDRHQALYNDTEKLLSEMNIELEKGVKVFYKNKKVITEKGDNGKFKTVVENVPNKDGTLKTEKYQNIIDYINNKKISNKKKKELIVKFDEYINNLGNSAKSESNIHKDVFLLLEQDFRPTEEHLQDLKTEIEKIENQFSNTEKLKNKLPFSDKINNEYNLLKDFRELIYSGQWIGTEKEYKDAVNEILTNKTKITANINNKLGTGSPKTKFNDIISKGQRLFRESERIKKTLFSTIGDNIENSKKKDLLKNIEDYISYKMGNNELEKKARDELNGYLDKVISGDTSIESEIKLKTEIAKILKGGLTEDTLIDKLDDCIRDDFTEEQKQKVKILIEDISNNPKTIITEIEIDSITSEIIDGCNLNIIRIDHSNQIDLTTIDSEIESAKGMRKKDIFPEGANETRIKEDFDKVKAIIEFDEKGNNSLRTEELRLLKENIINRKNNYTISQAIYAINEIQNGKKLKTLDTDLAPNTSETLDDLVNEKIEKLKLNFDGLSIDEKIQYLNENKEHNGNNTKKNILEEHIEKTISEIETDNTLSNPEKVSKAEELRRSIKNDIDSNRIKSGIDKLIGLKGISNLEKSLSSFENEVRNQNPNKSRLKNIITELDKLYSNDLSDDNLRNNIDILKTEINDTLNGNTGGGRNNPNTNSPETDYDRMTPEEISEKIDKFSEIYERAILKAEIQGNYDLAEKLETELDERFTNFDEKSIVEDVKTLESKFKGILRIRNLKSLDKLELEYTQLEASYKIILVDKGIGEFDTNGKYIYKELSDLETKLSSISNPSIPSYFRKAFKSGS